MGRKNRVRSEAGVLYVWVEVTRNSIVTRELLTHTQIMGRKNRVRSEAGVLYVWVEMTRNSTVTFGSKGTIVVCQKFNLFAGKVHTKMPEVATERNTESEPLQKRQCTMPLDSVLLRFAKLTEHAFTPTRGSKLAAGYDLYRSKICV